MLDEPQVGCPYCGETITVVVDTTSGSQCYVEDCFVCCRPIVLDIVVGPNGNLEAVDASAEND